MVASAAVMGLLAAAQTGQGQRVELDMFGANAYANFDDFVDVGAGSARLPLMVLSGRGASSNCIRATKVG